MHADLDPRTLRITLPSLCDAWVVVPDDGRSATLIDALSDAGFAVAAFTVDPTDAAGAVHRATAAVAHAQRLAGGLPVSIAAAGRSVGVALRAASESEVRGVVLWQGRFRGSWWHLPALDTPALFLAEPRVSRQLVNRIAARRTSGPASFGIAPAESGVLNRWYERLTIERRTVPPRTIRSKVGPAALAAALALPVLAAPVAAANSTARAHDRFAAVAVTDVQGDSAAASSQAEKAPKRDRFDGGSAVGDVRGDGLFTAAGTGSGALTDGNGVKHFVNTNITFATSSSASAAMSEASFTGPVAASTLNGGTTASTLGDAYDGYQSLCVDVSGASGACQTGNASFVMYNQLGSAPTSECSGRQLAFPTQTINSGGVANVEVSRKVFVPDNDHFARWANIVHNADAGPQTLRITTGNNLGSDSNTRIVATSSGDAAATTADTWVTSFQNFSGTTSSDPRLGHVFQGAGAALGTSQVTFNDGNDNPFWSYDLTLQPGQTVVILNYGVVEATKAAAAAQSIAIANSTNTHMFDCLTAGEIAAVANFGAPTVDLASPTISVDRSAGVAHVTVQRSSGVGAASVRLTTADGTAVAGTDYTSTDTVVSFADGEISKVVDVPLLANAAATGPVTFSVTLSQPTGLLLGTTTTAAVTITTSVVPVATTTTTTPTTTTTEPIAVVSDELPRTGADGLIPLAQLGASAAAGGAFITALASRRRRRRHQEPR